MTTTPTPQRPDARELLRRCSKYFATMHRGGSVDESVFTGLRRDLHTFLHVPAAPAVAPASGVGARHPDGREVFAYIGWPKDKERFHLDIIYPNTTRISEQYDYRPLYGPPLAAPSDAQPEWRCFHCDEVFTDHAAALDHFGPSLCSEPACKIDAAEYRRMEEQVRRCNAEDSDKDRAIYALRAHHAVMLIREEERGYAKGLADAQPAQAVTDRKDT